MEVKKKASSTFARKSDFVNGEKVKIVDFYERPNNFNDKKIDNVLVLELASKEIVALEINNTNFNWLVDEFGTETDDWKDKKLVIEAADEGLQIIEGVERQCYSLVFTR